MFTLIYMYMKFVLFTWLFIECHCHDMPALGIDRELNSWFYMYMIKVYVNVTCKVYISVFDIDCFLHTCMIYIIQYVAHFWPLIVFNFLSHHLTVFPYLFRWPSGSRSISRGAKRKSSESVLSPRSSRC